MNKQQLMINQHLKNGSGNSYSKNITFQSVLSGQKEMYRICSDIFAVLTGALAEEIIVATCWSAATSLFIHASNGQTLLPHLLVKRPVILFGWYCVPMFTNTLLLYSITVCGKCLLNSVGMLSVHYTRMQCQIIM